MRQASVHDFSNIEECKLFEGIKCDKCKVCESEMEKWLISKGVKTVTKRFTNHDDIIVDIKGEQLISTDEIADKMNELYEENQDLATKKEDAEYELLHLKEKYEELLEENEQLKKNRFICLDCEHSGYIEIGCLCEYNDYWQEYITECEDFKGLRE